MDSSHLRRLDDRPLHATVGGVDAYMVVRNEAGRLPFVLDHHRRLGVERFFVVDNDSDDGTAELLLSQPDCRVFHTTQSFAAAGCGMDWINALVARHGRNRWCLFIDADELFVYPHAERVGLPEFCHFLHSAGFEGVFAIMVDMYGSGGLTAAPGGANGSLIEICPLFDGDYELRSKISLPFSKRFQEVEAVGGPRLRVFYPELRHAGRWRIALSRIMRRLSHSGLNRILRFDRFGLSACPPDITKIPLMFARPNNRWVSNHRTTPLPLAPVTGALLHFKLLPDFAERARIEAARGEHWGGGSEYARYSALLAEMKEVSFVYEGSRRCESSDDLLRAGILRTSTEFDEFVLAHRRRSRSSVRFEEASVVREKRA